MSIPTEQWNSALPGLPISALIAEGGMAAVYHATQSSLERPVAVKVLTLEGQADPAFVDLFQQEARTMAQLDHPNICHVYDFGYRRPYLYLVMELIEGGSLHQHILAGHLTPEMSVALFAQSCEGLGYAHAQGVLHHDIKPSNLMINEKGNVKLVDFGLAQMKGQVDEDAPLFGTPGYIAPERLIEGGVVDHRADIYSMGALLYEMLVGEAPPQDSTQLVPASRRAQTPAALDPIIAQCLAPDPGQRFADVPALLAALKQSGSRTKTRARLPVTGAGIGRKRGPRVAKTGGTAGRGRGPKIERQPATVIPVDDDPPAAPAKSKIQQALDDASSDSGGGDEKDLASKPAKVARTEDAPAPARLATGATGGSSAASEAGRRDAARVRAKAEQDAKMGRGVFWAGMGVLALFGAIAATVVWYRMSSSNKVAPAEDPSQAATSTTKPVDVQKDAPSTPARKPYTEGLSIPGRIQFEEYDHGGPGVAYKDDRLHHGVGRNEAFRADEGVDAFLRKEPDGGDEFVVIGQVETGEWLEHSLASIKAGTYDIVLRYASPNGSQRGLAIDLAGDEIRLAPIRGTQGWFEFKELKFPGVELAGGKNQVLRTIFYGGGMDVDWIEFRPVGE